MKVSGIYKILNKINDKYYVGSSLDIIDRWDDHHRDLLKNIHTNDKLQNAWNKHGKENFDWVIIEYLSDTITKSELLMIEQKYLDIGEKDQHQCYNLNFRANGGKLSEYSIQKLRLKNKGKNNPQYDHKLYNFYNIKNKEVFTGTQHDFKNKTGIYQPSYLVTGRCKSRKSWILFSNKSLYENGNFDFGKGSTKYLNKKGRNNSFHDPKVYSFINEVTNEIYTGIRSDFYHKYNLRRESVCNLVNRKTKSVKNWKLKV